MTVLHMETDTVRNLAQQMKQNVEHMIELTRNIVGSTQSMNWVGPSRDEFAAEMERVTQAIQFHLEAGSLVINRAELEANEWENCASTLAGSYENLFAGIRKITLPASISAMLLFPSSRGSTHNGTVLGATTSINEISTAGGGVALSSAEYMAHYQSMSWSDKFVEQNNLNTEINRISGLLPQDIDGEFTRIDNQISNIDIEIENIQAQRDIAVKKSQGLFNQIIPDLPLERDKEDGLPWRVRADDYEDQIKGYDQELAKLQSQRDKLVSEQTSLQINLAELEQLKGQKDVLDSIINKGIKSDGPTEPAWYKDGFGGCTNYVAEKRDLYISSEVRISGNAQDWRDSAIKSGWDVGKQPVKGSIMVFQGEASTDYKTATRAVGGHVAYVEDVSMGENGNYKVTISEASTIFNKDGTFIRGAHTKVNIRTIEVPASGHKYADFIYDKPK